MEHHFKALVVRENEGNFSAKVETLPITDLPQNEVLIKVRYSSVNFKDTMSAIGNKGVTQKFPHVPGIDAVGEVVTSSNSKFITGDHVIVTGYDLGMNTWGGFGEYISVPSAWVVALHEELSPLEAMSYGTAGLTAGLSVYHLIRSGIKPEDGKVVVSGATDRLG